MIIHCPSCGYSRKPTDSAPKTECPECKIVFEEFLSQRPAKKTIVQAATSPRATEEKTALRAPPEVKVIPETPKTTSCPACGGLVAYGAKTCPHCGKANPAPVPKKPMSTFAKVGILVLMLAAIGNMISNPGSGTASSPSSSEITPEIRYAVQEAIKFRGYRCDSLSYVGRQVFGSGYRVTCNNDRYAYSINDEGGRWVVKLD
jgi:hypothetical protein